MSIYVYLYNLILRYSLFIEKLKMNKTSTELNITIRPYQRVTWTYCFTVGDCNSRPWNAQSKT